MSGASLFGWIRALGNLPHARSVPRCLVPYPAETQFVVYCAGPHCNGADRAAIRRARLGRPVKKRIGGVTGWLDGGFTLESGASAS